MSSPGVFICFSSSVMLAYCPVVALERVQAGLHLKKLVSSYCDGAASGAILVASILGLGLEGFLLTRQVDQQQPVALFDGLNHTFGKKFTDWAWERAGRECQARNIKASEATVVLAHAETKDTREAVELCALHHKPVLVLESCDHADAERLYEWACAYRCQSLNIAGNREGEIGPIRSLSHVTAFLMRSFVHRT